MPTLTRGPHHLWSQNKGRNCLEVQVTQNAGVKALHKYNVNQVDTHPEESSFWVVTQLTLLIVMK